MPGPSPLILSLLFPSLLASWAGAQAAAEPQVHVFESGYGFGAYDVTNLDGIVGEAIQLSTGHAFLVTNKVMVLTSDVDLLQQMLASDAANTDPGDARSDPNAATATIESTNIPGLHVVVATTVASAIRLTQALEPVFGVGKVHLNTRQPVQNRSLPADPLFDQQWHLVNTVDPLIDCNADAAWNLGYTGAGVTIGIVDSGSSWGHEDLAANYNSAGSTTLAVSEHGSGVAGVAAAVEGNGLGVVGMAYGAEWCNLIHGDAFTTATNLAYKNQINDLKNCSWGPFDDGTLWTMSPSEMLALETSIATGRGGLGEIFVWAAGNGGQFDDRVDYDPYASSRYTIAIGGIGDADERSNFNESGSSMMAVTHTSGNTRKITTTDTIGYSTTFGGTSSAAPLASGQVALALEANPNLTWRDMQHVIVHSARMVDPTQSNWIQNGAGHDFNHHYGFGALDAAALAQTAASWTNASALQTYSSGPIPVNQSIPDDDPNGFEFTISVPDHMRTEHFELILNATHNAVGHLKIWVRTPDGTRSLFTKERIDTKHDLVNYVFTSVRSWDEWADGDWTFHISDETLNTHGVLIDYELRVYGNDGSHLDAFRITQVDNLAQGSASTLHVAGASPIEKCWAVYSLTGAGTHSLPQLGLDLDLDSPLQIGMYQMTDAAGNASFSRSVPPLHSSGIDIWFQAVQMNSKTSVFSATIQ